MLAVILVITAACYVPVFDSGKEFVNWDDDVYVERCSLVSSFTIDSIPAIFDTDNHVASNYHPLTILSMGLTHAFIGSDARAFAGVNLLLHMFNTALVFLLVYRLSRGRLWACGLTALWFGIHPMHVESVAWVSQRKDVLYAFFLLLSLLAYVRYVSDGRSAMLGLAFLAFVASCLAKAMAVPLALVLVLIDYWYGRRFTPRVLAEKLPFLFVAVIIGLLAVSIQSKVAIADFDALTMPQRVAFASYGFIMYWVKIIAPFDLVTFYPYPALQANGEIASWYFLMPLVALAMLTMPIVLLRRAVLARSVFILGMGFFVLFVVLVLQFLQVGDAIMADRYTYVPYIGSFFILAMAADSLIARFGKPLAGGVVLVSAALVPLTYSQVSTWAGPESLWSKVIRHHPCRLASGPTGIRVIDKGAAIAYAGRGSYYFAKARYDEAFEDLKIVEYTALPGAAYYLRLGLLYGQRGDKQGALRALTTANLQAPNDPQILYNRGITLAMLGKTDAALVDLQGALAAASDAETREKVMVVLARETFGRGENAAAISWCDRLNAEFPSNAASRFITGTMALMRGDNITAVRLLTESVRRDSSDVLSWSNLAMAHLNAGDVVPARQAASRAKELGGRLQPQLEQRLR